MCDGCGCVAPELMCAGCQVICCCLMATNQILKQSLDPVWSRCYLTGPGDLDKTLELCACGDFWVGFGVFLPESFVPVLSQPCVAQLISSCHRKRAWDVQSFSSYENTLSLIPVLMQQEREGKVNEPSPRD